MSAPISLDLRTHSGSGTPVGQALRAFRVYRLETESKNQEFRILEGKQVIAH